MNPPDAANSRRAWESGWGSTHGVDWSVPGGRRLGAIGTPAAIGRSTATHSGHPVSASRGTADFRAPANSGGGLRDSHASHNHAPWPAAVSTPTSVGSAAHGGGTSAPVVAPGTTTWGAHTTGLHTAPMAVHHPGGAASTWTGAHATPTTPPFVPPPSARAPHGATGGAPAPWLPLHPPMQQQQQQLQLHVAHPASQQWTPHTSRAVDTRADLYAHGMGPVAPGTRQATLQAFQQHHLAGMGQQLAQVHHAAQHHAFGMPGVSGPQVTVPARASMVDQAAIAYGVSADPSQWVGPPQRHQARGPPARGAGSTYARHGARGASRIGSGAQQGRGHRRDRSQRGDRRGGGGGGAPRGHRDGAASSQRAARIKTKLCHAWVSSGGSCARGDACDYAHGNAELRVIPVTRNPRYRTKLCSNWLASGECGHADQCMFAHGVSELRQSADRQHRKFKMRLCKNWLVRRGCGCAWSLGPPSWAHCSPPSRQAGQLGHVLPHGHVLRLRPRRGRAARVGGCTQQQVQVEALQQLGRVQRSLLPARRPVPLRPRTSWRACVRVPGAASSLVTVSRVCCAPGRPRAAP